MSASNDARQFTPAEYDAACRGAIALAGLSKAFVHRTGYSVGAASIRAGARAA
jgi:Xaa-Pro aminopeptidase